MQSGFGLAHSTSAAPGPLGSLDPAKGNDSDESEADEEEWKRVRLQSQNHNQAGAPGPAGKRGGASPYDVKASVPRRRRPRVSQGPDKASLGSPGGASGSVSGAEKVISVPSPTKQLPEEGATGLPPESMSWKPSPMEALEAARSVLTGDVPS